MINNALTSNVRDANGGDIAVTSQTKPFTRRGNPLWTQSGGLCGPLASFDALKSNRTISNYTPIISSTGSIGNSASLSNNFTIQAVGAHAFPLVTPPTFVTPAHPTISTLLVNNQVIVDKTFADQYHKKVRDTPTVHVGTSTGGSERILRVALAGIVTDSRVLAQSSSIILISNHDFIAAAQSVPVFYDTIDVTTTGATHTDQAVKAIQAQFPIASTQTAAHAPKSQQNLTDTIKKFLEIAGL